MAVVISDILLSLLPALASYILILFCKKLFLRRRRNPQTAGNKAEEDSDKPEKLPPGKTDGPFLSETRDFYSKFQDKVLHEFVLERINKYSSKIFKTSLIGQPVAVFSGPEGNKFLFSNRPELLRHWIPTTIQQLLPATVSNDKKQIHEMRKFYTSSLRGDSLKSYVRIFDSTIKEFLQTSWNDAEEEKDEMISKLAQKYAVTSGCKIFLGINDQRKIDELEEYIKAMTVGIYSTPINFPGTDFHRAIKSSQKLFQGIAEIIRQRKIGKDATSSDHPDIISHFVQSSSTGIDRHGQLLSEDQIATYISGFFVGSYSGIHTTIAHVINHLAELPQVYHMVLREQEEIASSKGANEALQWEDVMKMKYSWNVVCETLRLKINGGGYKEALHDFNFGGYTIPKGWKLHWNLSATHWNPEYFPDPEKFDPSRFEGDGPAPYTFIPFGGGGRMCPGNEFAKFSILIFIHNLVTNSVGKSKFPMKLSVA
ncbi:OLC1v1012052C1 [Oldenlandia corymbosa var. corymbosa]|uniref:OLC1v1012052C1 n=1 Tax=Oldenlandia corymbosa var. corymbosa TaxID=529605 RepID=A0AAV1DV79_OLDCO|nr:OLC1v1012052C1 [Oldenlandia corymbosa var. corymbosa]